MRRWKLVPILLATVALTACFHDDDDPVIVQEPAPAPATFELQVLHAAPDAPPVNVFVDGAEVLSNVDYKSGSGRFELDAGVIEIQVDGILPGGNGAVIGPFDLTFDPDLIYTVVAVGQVAAGSNTPLEGFVFNQPREAVSASSARLAVLHGAPLAPGVDVFVTAPGADLTASAPVGSFEYMGTLGPTEVAAGDYQIRVTLAGDAQAVVYDSGTVTLNDGDDLFLAAVENTATGASPISLVALNGSGSLELADAATPAALRVVHAASDAPAVDVLADGTTLVNGLEFPQVTPFLEVPPANYLVEVEPTSPVPVDPVITANLTLDAGTKYTALAIGTLANDTLDALVAADDPRPVSAYAKVRIIHAAEAAQLVDVYVTAVGADINNESPTIADFAFLDNTGFLTLPAGEYDVSVTPAGTKDVAIFATIGVANGGVYTAIARDPSPMETELGLILADDFVAP